MSEEFSLIKFLERITYLEEKFNCFLSESKKNFNKDIKKMIILKESLISDILLELIPITDSMEMFSKSFDINQTGEIEIMVLIFKLINKFYKKFNVKQISKIGIEFNPDMHEAIGMYPTNIYKKGTIKTVLQTGYIRNDSLIRPALVIVYN
ncbi:nucleotide exchange factor GrpE [Candidatus Carsonella ruddii]|uniref:Chaperone protein GrpE n=1 Tax=Candidatus Carsonella ruddii CE isolate Thao2000 TaxID=1202536 RepID=J7GY98_CARRU|nr:nucleotide exchange factor GrpE [Candidatus Carsonella ruddii]AFP83548.1 chaperone protein GrpE [Candidatus Carsonella ruddii CE isolate Thao2000]